MGRVRAYAVTIGAVVVIFGSIVVLQNRLTGLSRSSEVPQSMAYLPESDKIIPWFLGFQTVVGDYLWIRTTLYFGGHLLKDRQYPWLLSMVDMVTKLNPRFYPAYEFAGLLLPDVCKNLDAAKILLQRGISANVKNTWKLYFYLGMLYYKYSGDYKNAAYFIAVAAQMPDAPAAKLTGLATTFFSRAHNELKAKEFEYLMYNISENPEVRRYLMGKMSQLGNAQ
jgi:hypothetical protein